MPSLAPRPLRCLPVLGGILLAACSSGPAGHPQPPPAPPAAAPACTADTQCPPYQACSAGACVQLPEPPGNLQATPGTGIVDLSWEAVPGATSYVVSAALQEDPVEWTKLGEGAPTRAHVFAIPDDTTLYFAVQAANVLGAGRLSAPVAATTALQTVTVRGAGTSLIVAWTTTQTDPHFDLFRASTASGPFEQIASRVESPTADMGLGDGQTRWYRVRPSRGGADSNAASASTRPPPPTGLSSTSDSTGDVIFSWQPAAGAQHYLLQGTTREPSTFGAGVDTTSVSVAVSPRLGSLRYQASVVALNDAGQSDPSNVAGGLTAPSLRTFFAGPGRTHLEFEGGGQGTLSLSRGPSPDGPWTPVASQPFGFSSFEIVDNDAPGFATVWYRAQGIDPLGPGDSSLVSLQTFAAPDVSNAASFSGSGCEPSARIDTSRFADQGFVPGVTGTLMGLQASVSLPFVGATVEAHVLDGNGNDLGHATVPSIGSCPQPLTESVQIMYADLSHAAIHVTAGTPMRLQLRVVGVPQAFADVGVTLDAYPGSLTIPGELVDGEDLILRTFVKADPP